MGLIRYFLAAAVVIAHSDSLNGVRLLPGNLAVEMFFIISGFYMSLILGGKYHARNWSGVANFYASRFFRLWPIYIFIVILINCWWIVASVYLGRPPTGVDYRAIVDPTVFVALQLSNIFMVGLDLSSLFHVSESGGIHFTMGVGDTLADGSLWLGYVREVGQAWSVGTEIWFYLLAPFLVGLRSRWLILLAALSLALRMYLNAVGLNVYFFFPAQVALFLVGMLAHRSCRSDWIRHRVVACFGIVSLFAGFIAFGSLGNVDERFKWGLYAIFALTVPSVFHHTKDWRYDRILGELSYPIYISHMFILSLLIVGGKRVGIAITGEALLAVTTAVSFAIYLAIDRPIARWRQRFSRPMAQLIVKDAKAREGLLARTKGQATVASDRPRSSQTIRSD